MRSIINFIKNTYQMVETDNNKTVFNNVVSLSGLQIISYVLPIIILPYLFRILGADKFGLISFAQAFVQYFIILTDYGFNVCATQEISLNRDNKVRISRIHSAVMTIKTIFSVLSLTILLAVVFLIPKFKHDWLIYVLSFGAVIGNALFPMWFFQGIEKMKHIAQFNIAGAFIFTILILIFVRDSSDYLAVPLITSCVSLAIGIWSQVFLFREYDLPWKRPFLKDILFQLKTGWNVFISIVAINSYTSTRIFAVGLLTNNALTGFYTIAERIANVVQTFPLSSFTQAVFPRLSKIYEKSTHKAFEIMSQIQLITVWVSVICIPITFIFSDLIISLVCGGDYPEAVLSLKLLLISVFFVACNAFKVQFLLVSGKSKEYSRIHLTMASVALPLIIALIYFYSYVGAALATAFIEGGIFTLTFLTLRKLKF